MLLFNANKIEILITGQPLDFSALHPYIPVSYLAQAKLSLNKLTTSCQILLPLTQESKRLSIPLQNKLVDCYLCLYAPSGLL